jgi:hypothetical protein
MPSRDSCAFNHAVENLTTGFVSQIPFSTFLTLLWTEKLNFIPSLEFKPVHLLV